MTAKNANMTILLSIVLTGCASMMIDDNAGQLRPDGTITPCGTFHTNAQACGNAKWNSKVIRQVAAAQTKEQVRSIMKHDPERREIDGSEERWFYLTDYDAELMTVITFVDDRITALRQVPWK